MQTGSREDGPVPVESQAIGSSLSEALELMRSQPDEGRQHALQILMHRSSSQTATPTAMHDDELSRLLLDVCCSGNELAARLLLEQQNIASYCLDVNLVGTAERVDASTSCSATGSPGKTWHTATPLIAAAERGFAGIVELLLCNAADAGKSVDGRTARDAAHQAAAAAADAGPTVATRGKCAGLGASFGMLDGARLDADRRRCIELLDRASGALAHVSQVAQVASNLYAPELCVRLCLPLTCIPTCTLASRATVGMRRTCLRATCVLTRQWFRCW